MKPTKSDVLGIDLGNLHLELRHHQTNVRFYGELEAKARRRLALAKDMLELAEAELDKEVRRKLVNEKLTEAAVKMAIIRHPHYQKAKKAVRDAQHVVNVVHVMVVALEHKKQSLHDEVSLEGRNYWDVSTWRKEEENWLSKRERQTSKIRTKMRLDDE